MPQRVEPGATIGHYRVTERLGGGGMGEVFRAVDTRLDRPVALKFLPENLAKDDQALQRFQREARTASALNHPNICTIYDIGEDDGRPFIVMELLEGQTLKHRIRGSAVPLDELLDMAIQMADGLRAAHGKGIVHRDIKPPNVFVGDEHHVKILDFGLAKLTTDIHRGGASGDSTTAAADDHSAITSRGVVVGTVAHMSPEQARGEALDARTDLFSFGVLLYEMATGTLPFVGATPAVVFKEILDKTPTSVSAIDPSLPDELGRIISRLLHKARAQRYQTADELHHDLVALKRQLDSGQVQAASRSGSIQAVLSRRPWPAAVVTGASVALLAAVGFYLGGTSQDPAVTDLLVALEEPLEAGNLDAVAERIAGAGVDLDDPAFAAVAERVGGALVIGSEPPDALVELKRVSPIAGIANRAFMEAGRTPIRQTVIAGEYLVRLSTTEVEPVVHRIEVDRGGEADAAYRLVSAETGRGGMVVVPEGASPLSPEVVVPGFLIDRHEVTNEEFLRFVSAGGYQEASYWPDDMVVRGTPVPAMSAGDTFADRTGLPGPRYWSGGTYPEGMSEHPVVGVSWYEASAYAAWRGVELPTLEQWYRSALGDSLTAYPWGDDVTTVEFRANFDLPSTAVVGSYPAGVSPFGCTDMAGNVREWLLDVLPGTERRAAAGGAWQDPTYMFERDHAESFAPAFVSDALGFRCVMTDSPAP